MNDHPPHAHGLRHDLEHLARLQAADRRRALRLFGGLAAGSLPLLGLAGCGGASEDAGTSGSSSGSSSFSSSSSSASTSSGSGSTVSSCSSIPSETAGPYPGDGTNSNSSGVVNVLTQSGIVRSDIRSSFGTMSGTAAGVPLTVTLKLVSVSAACANLEGYAVYLWHCTRDGGYSLYSSGVTAQNYLRGVQVSNASGELTFTTIFPGCYSGRWPHIHFEVFSSLASATSGNSDVLTSQLALPESVCRSIYGSASGYTGSLTNLNAITLASDNIFSDGYSTQMATVTGDATNGFAATLTIGV